MATTIQNQVAMNATEQKPMHAYIKSMEGEIAKYAPLKSDFVRAAAQDMSIKTQTSDDMYDVPPADIVDMDAEEIPVDESTGEIVGRQ